MSSFEKSYQLDRTAAGHHLQQKQTNETFSRSDLTDSQVNLGIRLQLCDTKISQKLIWQDSILSLDVRMSWTDCGLDML